MIDSRPVGMDEVTRKDLAPFAFCVAMSHNRILKVEEDKVTFRYRDGDSGR